MASTKTDIDVVNNAAPITFSKAKIMTFDRYANRRDLLSALLKDGKKYTIDQVDRLIQNFMKGKVK